MKTAAVPDQWPYTCQVCGGWCRPAADVLSTTDPLARGGLLSRAFLHSLGKRAEGDPEELSTA